ncbi:MAG: hypothetical protein Q7W45_08495 [Bacteroidota bacterium]|nr:hypothetical protein [Bacteroidota bacterium]MDP3144283.1 hypothetical protein [Bacteroidota bacterium]
MKTTETTNKISNVLNAVVNMNDLAGNEFLKSDIDALFLSFQMSKYCNEITPGDRERITLMYLNIKKLAEASSGLKSEDFDKSFPLNISKYLIEKDLLDDYMIYCKSDQDS